MTCDNCASVEKTKTQLTEIYVYGLIEQALTETLSERRLLQFGVGERSIAHRFACIMNRLVEGEPWMVDCEYNRMKKQTKLIPKDILVAAIDSITGESSDIFKETDFAEAFATAKEDVEYELCRKKERPRRVLPDVVIHYPGCDCYNLVVIEMKVGETALSAAILDWAKLLAFTTSKLESAIPFYPWGFYLNIKSNETVVWLFESGKAKVLSSVPHPAN